MQYYHNTIFLQYGAKSHSKNEQSASVIVKTRYTFHNYSSSTKV